MDRWATLPSEKDGDVERTGTSKPLSGACARAERAKGPRKWNRLGAGTDLRKKRGREDGVAGEGKRDEEERVNDDEEARGRRKSVGVRIDNLDRKDQTHRGSDKRTEQCSDVCVCLPMCGSSECCTALCRDVFVCAYAYACGFRCDSSQVFVLSFPRSLALARLLIFLLVPS